MAKSILFGHSHKLHLVLIKYSKRTDRERELKLNSNKPEHTHSICEALLELKTWQDLLTNSSTKYFGSLLEKIAGVDTIPLLLLKKDGPLSHKVLSKNEKSGKHGAFESSFFRLESVDQKKSYAIVSILFPVDFKGNHTNSLYDVMKLEKTSHFIEVDLSYICAIQLLDTTFLKRKIIVEPKW